MTTKNDIILPRNPRWMSETEVCRQYAVGSLRLNEYSNRGDLACRFGHRGEVLYDAYAVEGLFRLRSASMTAPKGGQLGQIGRLSLGVRQETEVVQHRPKIRSLSSTRAA